MMLSPKPSEVWLVRFPFTDLTSAKVRPSLIVATHQQDVIILGIFSKIPGGTLPETWVLVRDRHPQFSRTGLSKSSLIKTEKIATVHKSVFQRQLGTIPSNLLEQTQAALKKALSL